MNMCIQVELKALREATSRLFLLQRDLKNNLRELRNRRTVITSPGSTYDGGISPSAAKSPLKLDRLPQNGQQ